MKIIFHPCVDINTGDRAINGMKVIDLPSDNQGEVMKERYAAELCGDKKVYLAVEVEAHVAAVQTQHAEFLMALQTEHAEALGEKDPEIHMLEGLANEYRFYAPCKED